MKPWMIYGANGYTGRLTAQLAKQRGLEPILAGRNAREVLKLGEELGFKTSVFDLASPMAAVRALTGVGAVLNCAGPFSRTARAMTEACCRAACHYLDITGEIGVFEDIHQRSAEFRKAGIVAMPGAGFDVVPSDCLAAMLKRELPAAVSLRLAFKSRYGKLSPGTTKTMAEGAPEGGKVRRDGKIVPVPPAYKVVNLPIAEGEAPALAVSIPWGDVSTAFYSTGIPNIETYIATSPGQLKQMKTMGRWGWLLGLAPVRAFVQNQIGKRVKGPSLEERARDEMWLWGEAKAADGKTATLRLRVPEGYTFTADSGIACVLGVLKGELQPGALTPSMAFGPDFVLGLEGVRLHRPE